MICGGFWPFFFTDNIHDWITRFWGKHFAFSTNLCKFSTTVIFIRPWSDFSNSWLISIDVRTKTTWKYSVAQPKVGMHVTWQRYTQGAYAVPDSNIRFENWHGSRLTHRHTPYGKGVHPQSRNLSILIRYFTLLVSKTLTDRWKYGIGWKIRIKDQTATESISRLINNNWS